MTRSWKRASLLLVVGLTIGCDQVTKHLATEFLMKGKETRHYFDGALHLVYAENTGAFLSLGSKLEEWQRTALFSVGTGLVLLFCVVSAWRQRLAPIPLTGLALVFAGGVSNLLDRVAHGYVVDFLNVGIGSLRTGIFNVADMAIMLGVAMMLFAPRS